MKAIAKTAVTLLILTSLTAQAQSPNQGKKELTSAGGNTGGGGSELVSKFVMQAKELLDRIEATNPHDRDVENVRKTLHGEELKIVLRQRLLNPETNEAIPDQEKLLAWGSIGLIQLKPRDWEEAFLHAKKMDHHIFHELCRATPECNDEAYRLSIGKLKLAPSSTKSSYDQALADGVNALKGRDASIPLANYKECIEPKDTRLSPITTPTTSEEVILACRKNFMADQDKQGFIFASENTLVGVSTIRERYNLIEKWYIGDDAFWKETRETSQNYSDRRAIGTCRHYAAEQGLNPENCKILARFSASKVSGQTRGYSTFEGGYVTRSLAILNK